MTQEKITGAQAAIESLERLGVEFIFGYPGGANIPIFDALLDSKIKLILARHEQGATHMADGYARASRRPGVVLVTSGPGATNTVTGIMTAQMDSVPLVVISGQTVTGNLGLDAFQEADVLGITFPVVKHSYLVKDVEAIPRVIREAFHVAETGRPGPVLIDIPKDVSSGLLVPDYDGPLDLPGYRVPAGIADKQELARVVPLINQAQRPLLLAGHGAIISGAHRAIKALAEKTQMPVTTTLLGKGAFPENHELSLGMLGMHGTAYANLAVQHCDLILSVGSRWDDRIVGDTESFCRDAVKIHVDIDQAEWNKMITVDAFVLGHARQVCEALTEQVEPRDRKAWLDQVQGWKTEHPLSYETNDGLTAQQIVDELNRLTKGSAIVATDVGQHQMWAAQFYRSRNPDQWLSSGGAGTMGFGLPAALGAQLRHPEQLVVALVGDGGFQMTSFELATAVIHRLPVKVIIFDNKCLGMVRQWQDLFFDNRTSGIDLQGNPDFVKLAEAYGAKGLHLNQTSDVTSVLEEALVYRDGPCVVHAEIRPEDNVFPMIPSGAGYDKMLLSRPEGPLEKPKGST
jgi:acetolactate synthase-1/2/3 large subunit